MKIIRDNGEAPSEEPLSAAFGIMDGVHLGHRKLLEETAARAHEAGLTPALITLDPHPVRVLCPDLPPQMLTTLEEKAKLAASVGIELMIVQDFASVRDISPEAYLRDITGRLRVRHVTVGGDYTFGCGGRGDVSLLRGYLGNCGVGLRIMDTVMRNGERVSSTRIRELLLEGRPDEAAELLGAPWQIGGVVEHGFKRGTGMGFPTVNVPIPTEKLRPKKGVYASSVRVGDRVWRAISNLGINPTFNADGSPTVLESHILDYEGESLYDTYVSVDFVKYIRPEKRFESPEALIAQINKDIATAREIHGMA